MLACHPLCSVSVAWAGDSRAVLGVCDTTGGRGALTGYMLGLCWGQLAALSSAGCWGWLAVQGLCRRWLGHATAAFSDHQALHPAALPRAPAVRATAHTTHTAPCRLPAGLTVNGRRVPFLRQLLQQQQPRRQQRQRQLRCPDAGGAGVRRGTADRGPQARQVSLLVSLRA